jgi:tetratricopeptide (TPR) repeat protein
MATAIGGTLNMKPRNRRNLRLVDLTRLLLGVALLLATGGCLTPQIVPIDGYDTVSLGQAKRDLGIDYLSGRRTAMAIRELRAAMDLEPNDPQTHLWLGEAYRRKGRTEEAERYLVESIRLSVSIKDSTSEQSARLTLSALLSQMGRYEDALEHCEAVAADATFSSPWRPLTNCGWALFQLDRIPEARAHYAEALDFYPRFGPALLNLGILETKQGRTLEAIKTLDRALASGRLGSSALGEANYRLGEIYIGLGRRESAVTHFREATKIAPNADWGSQSQAYLDLLL